MRPMDIDHYIRKVADFPKPGILFYDITSILVEPEAFAFCVETAKNFSDSLKPNAIAAIDARGFIFASPLACILKIPLILVRKKGKLPEPTLQQTYELEYGTETIEVHREDIKKGQRILIVDDIIATGGTLRATADILLRAGGTVVGIFAVLGLRFLNFQDKLARFKIHTMIDYNGS